MNSVYALISSRLSCHRVNDRFFSRARSSLSLEPLESRCLLAASPIINEFLARNDGGLRDGNGRTSDWIELLNVGDESVDLAGYRLTDSVDEPAKWVFPSTQLDAGEYLVVFASGADEGPVVDGKGNLHTNFTLKRGGEYLALISPDGSIISEFGAGGQNFPEQLVNVSYGTAQRLPLVSASNPAEFFRSR